MSKLGQVVESVEDYNKFVLDQVKRARSDQKFGRDLLGRWNDTKAKIPVTRTPTGVPLPGESEPTLPATDVVVLGEDDPVEPGVTYGAPLYIQGIEPNPRFAAFAHCPRLAG